MYGIGFVVCDVWYQCCRIRFVLSGVFVGFLQTPPVVVTPNVRLENLYELMNRCRLVRLPVLRTLGKYEGVVDR